MPKFKLVNKLTVSALCLALALVLRMLSVMVPLAGVAGMRVSLGGIFATLPALLFGPLYGAIVAGCADGLGYLLKPEGAFLPLLTVTAVLGGALRGWLWMGLKRVLSKGLVKASVILFSVLTLLGAANLLVSLLWPGSPWGHFLGLLKSKGSSQTGYATWLTLAVGIAGFLLLALYRTGTKKTQGTWFSAHFLQLLLVMLLSGLFITTLNTFILMDALGVKKAFLFFYTPRLAEEIFISVVAAFALAYLYPLAAKLKKPTTNDFTDTTSLI